MTKLSESEWKILSALWEKEPQTIMQLTDTLRDSTGWSKNTVITLLKSPMVKSQSSKVTKYEEKVRQSS